MVQGLIGTAFALSLSAAALAQPESAGFIRIADQP
jgi:hypothetical protein